MGRYKLPDELLKKVVSIRLQQKTIEEIEKIEPLQSFIEKSVEIYLQMRKNEEK
jgi:hypothetical protein